MPKVSVILTSYNHAAYIAAAIDSVLGQTFTDFELLIVDDGSQDNSRDVINTFADPRIKTFLYEENRGPVLAVIDAMKSAQGKYIAVHHSDDLWALDKLEKQVAFLDANPNYAACFTWVEFVDEQGKPNELDASDDYRKVFDQTNRTRAEWLNHFFYNANCLCHPSAMLRREVVEKFKVYEAHGFWQLPDYLAWIRLCFHAELFILPERLTQFRLRRERQENTSATTFDKVIRADLEFYFVAREFVDNFKDDKFFLEVFPEAEKFLIDGQINRRFAFAKICLDKKSNAEAAFQLVGLELIKELLNNPDDAAQIKKLYGYDEKSFLRDGGSFDVFNLASKHSMLHAEIFAGNDEDFSLVAEKIIDLDASRKFYGRFDFNLAEPVRYLRFDPDINFISLKINRVLINGKPCDNFSSNVGEIVNGFYRFWTSDPQIVFDVDNLSGRVTFEIFGESEADYSTTFNKTISEIIKRNAELQAENQRLTATATSTLNLKELLHSDKKETALAAARFLYKLLPLSEEKKVALKDKFYTSFAPLIKNTQRYKNWQISRALNVEVPPPVRKNFIYNSVFEGELQSQPGKIAIQVHIFYLDLLDEATSFCANMPYKFDALISIVDERAKDKVHAAFQKIPKAQKCIVRVVPNRGRDVAPFLVGFGDLLPEYDFIAHVHSKKSLYTGSEQKNWRNYLFDALLGSPERIRKIFKAFDDDETVGVIYPRPADNVPYSAFTWLSNHAVGQNLLKRAGIAPNKTDYFDFPAGTMFWARTAALKKFFACGLTINDFPPEQGQNDGTIAHAFERSILLAAKSEGMSYYEFDPDTGSYSVNLGNKNLWQYYPRTNQELRNVFLVDDGIISFDVFDTLLMRYVARPYHVNEIIRLKVEDLLGRAFDFPTWRIEAENLARQNKGGDVTLDEIYDSFSTLTGLNKKICERIRELEISTEVKLSLPREEVVALLKEAAEQGKRIWLISDMYMQTPDLKRLLDKCGVKGYEKLLISCETGMRKDTAAIWDFLSAKGTNLFHIGDNETSDIQLPSDRKHKAYHLMSAINLFSQIPFGRSLLEKFDYGMSLYAGICLGVVLAKKFQNPYRLNGALTDNTNRLILKTPREFGYWFYGVPLLTFILWLIKKSQEDGVKRILFLARDGYFLQPLYQFVAELLKVKPLPSEYFLASRRAVTVASISNISQAKELSKLKFVGTTKHFFKARFGLELGDDEEIVLPEKDATIVSTIIDEHTEEILQHATDERANYQKYINGIGGNLDRVGVVDMGYSGTIQFYLQELTGKTFTGYYFATCSTNRFGASAAKRMRGCFAENDDYSDTKSAVYRYQLLFEAILTAPDAQLQCFDAEGKPIFGKPEPGQKYFDEISEIHEGIKDFCRDVTEIFGDILLRVPIDKNFVNAWVKSFMNDDKIIAPELQDLFAVEDDYCNTFHGNAFEFYMQGLERPNEP